jgi:hypothetical protein
MHDFLPGVGGIHDFSLIHNFVLKYVNLWTMIGLKDCINPFLRVSTGFRSVRQFYPFDKDISFNFSGSSSKSVKKKVLVLVLILVFYKWFWLSVMCLFLLVRFIWHESWWIKINITPMNAVFKANQIYLKDEKVV